MSEQDIGRQICNLSNKLRRMIHLYASKDIENAEHQQPVRGFNGAIIAYIGRHQQAGKAVYQKDIGLAFGLTRSGTSRMISRLEEQGHIERCSVESDARKTQIVLSKGTNRFHLECERKSEEIEKQLNACFTAVELSQFQEYLNRFEDHLNDMYRKESNQ